MASRGGAREGVLLCRDAGAAGGATAYGLLQPPHLCRGRSQAAGGGEGLPHVPAAAVHLLTPTSSTGVRYGS